MEPRNYLANAAANPPTAPELPSNGFPRARVPSGPEATKPGAFWYYKIGEELRNLIIKGGLTPSDTDLTQVSKAVTAAGVPIGGIVYFAAPTASLPYGFLPTDHALLKKTTYSALWSCIGDTYRKAGDTDTTSFRVPDLRGLVVRGLDTSGTVDPGRVLGTVQRGSLIVGEDLLPTTSVNDAVVEGKPGFWDMDDVNTAEYVDQNGLSNLKLAAVPSNGGVINMNAVDIKRHCGVARMRNIALTGLIRAY